MLAIVLAAFLASGSQNAGPCCGSPQMAAQPIPSGAESVGGLALAGAPPLHFDPRASQPLAPVVADHAPGSCHARLAANGMQLPDPTCSPGAINPTLTIDVLLNPAFRTGMVRDKLTSAAAKRRVYVWYGIVPPKHNTGQNQTCELDHVVDIGAGGADSLANIWPQCERPGAPPVPVGQREFKTKDRFAEHDVMRQIKAGGDLADIQRRIAADWTQFVERPPSP